jgi:F-type H+-transporting ATPase subunit delta
MQHMRAASRQAVADARDRLYRYLDDASESEVEQLGEELFAVVDVLLAEAVLRRHLADPATQAVGKNRLLQTVFGRGVGKPTLDLLSGLVGARWSGTRDLVYSIEMLGQLALLALAQKQGAIEEVEDELFRAGRLIDREARLRLLLADPTAPVQRRVELLRSVLSGKVHPVTERQLVRAIQAPQGRSLDRAAEELSELAAASRERSVAKIGTPVGLSDDQQRRLTEALSRFYGRPIALRVELRPELIGGLVVRVGDEVIDGSLAARILAARQRLPH